MSVVFLRAAPFHSSYFFFFNDTATTEIYTLSLHDALPISPAHGRVRIRSIDETAPFSGRRRKARSEEHTSELQSRPHLVCRLLLEKKKKKQRNGKEIIQTHNSGNKRSVSHALLSDNLDRVD